MNTTYTRDQIHRYRTKLLAEGQRIADRLARLLAGEDLRLEDMQGLDLRGSGDPPKVRLRRYLDHLTATQRQIETADFGKCQRCADYIPAPELDEMPWADICIRCSSGIQN